MTMKAVRFSLCTLVLLAAASLAGCVTSSSTDRDVVFQNATIFALMEGDYDGDFTCAELKRHGDLGIGTFNGLAGEMVVVDGVVYQVRTDGRPYRVPDATETPFAAVTFFEPDERVTLHGRMTLDALEKRIDELLGTPNLPAAIRITGRFASVKARSVPRQKKPYPRLAHVVKTQTVWDLDDVEGVMVGFYMPGYLKDVTVTPYHLHFLTADRTGGGHVLDAVARDVVVEVDTCAGLFLRLPETTGFTQADLSRRSAEELERIEK